MNRVVWISLLAALLTLSLARPALADKPTSWYEAQMLNPETKLRLGVDWRNCCNQSEVVHTRFRVNRTNYEDEWWWLDGNTWRQVPSDTIHWNDPTPNGQPVPFIYQGQPTCFYPGDTGG
jgi:hypothetical protein